MIGPDVETVERRVLFAHGGPGDDAFDAARCCSPPERKGDYRRE
jgi:hypothetical protein